MLGGVKAVVGTPPTKKLPGCTHWKMLTMLLRIVAPKRKFTISFSLMRKRNKGRKGKDPKPKPEVQELEIERVWIDDYKNVPEDFKPTFPTGNFHIYTSSAESDWVRTTVKEFFDRGRWNC
jgi:hypothetical protein